MIKTILFVIIIIAILTYFQIDLRQIGADYWPKLNQAAEWFIAWFK